MNNQFSLSALPKEEAKAKITKPRTVAPAQAVEEPVKAFNVRLPISQIADLGHARWQDGITAVARIRALVELWRTDEEIQRRVAEIAGK